MGMKITGIGSTMAKLSRIHRRTNERQRKALEKGGEQIAELASEYAPIDKGNLERSIKSTAPRRNLFERKDVFVGVDPSVLGEGYQKYGFRYDEFIHDGEYDLGPKSQAKAAGGKDVGPEFLTRALKELEGDIAAELEQIAKEEALK